MPEHDIQELLAAVDLARRALAEITPEETIGEPAGHIVEGEDVVSLLFEAHMAGYPGWRWTVSVGRAEEDAAPTVLEAELIPGEDALLAPDWVPWSERLAEYQAAQEALASVAAEGEDGDDEQDDSDDDDERADFGDDDDFDDDDILNLHTHDDVDGVDIDSVDVAYDEETDVDPDLDLAAEEAAALNESALNDAPVGDSALERTAAGSAPSAEAFEAQIAEAENAEHKADDDSPEPGSPAGVGDGIGEHEGRDQGEQPQP